MKFKSLLLAGVATGAIVGAMALPAYANLILVEPSPTGPVPAPSIAASFTDLGSQGFGHAPRMLTMQTDGVETGSGTPINVTNGDAISGTDKTTTPTLTTLGWTAGNRVGVGFNSNQTGQTGITMQSLVLTIYGTNGTTVEGSFSLLPSLAPLDFTAADLKLQQGNGNAVFNFGLNAAEQTTFNAILAMSGSSGFFAGLSSQLGCPTGSPTSCEPSNDGADSFLGFQQSVPAPLIGHGLIALLAVGGALFGSKFLEAFKKHRLKSA